MMRLSRIGLLLVAFYVLTLTAAASAECAWVLWSHGLTKGTDGSHEIELARATRQECLAEVREMVATLKSRGYTVSGSGPNSSEVIGRQGDTRYKYFCLPDTVDPRGPKGK